MLSGRGLTEDESGVEYLNFRTNEMNDGPDPVLLAPGVEMLIQFDLNHNDLDALLHDCRVFIPANGDVREDRRLSDALEVLAEALENPLPQDLPIR